MTKVLPARIATMVSAILLVTFIPMPTATAQHCLVIGCWHECHPIPGGRRCREVCRRRCWHPPPQYDPPYVPEPEYEPPAYEEPVRHYAPAPSPDGGLIALGVLLVIILVIVAAASEGSDKVDEVHKATDKALASTDDAKSLAHRASATAKDIDRYIDQALKDAYARGRRGEDHHG
jgi:hypothetical protein